ncbi:MAG: FtsX-like permease family protein [Saprospiraceae bacterium]|nr:FtsX-like permease family protein [Saprospiraceae bacterium]
MLEKISFVIRFMALFSILTGIIVLISSVVLTKYQRVRESVLLRTLGASRRQILWINAIEYIMLGSLAALTGMLLSILGSYLLAHFAFDLSFSSQLVAAYFLVSGHYLVDPCYWVIQHQRSAIQTAFGSIEK